MMTEAITLGEGVLNWISSERVGDRYGAVHLTTKLDGNKFVTYEDAPVGTKGTIVAHVLETRQSAHIGDFARGVFPVTPEVGEAITLGSGTLFTEVQRGYPAIGVRPDDGRETDWMDIRALYRCHEQTVRLEFVPDGGEEAS